MAQPNRSIEGLREAVDQANKSAELERQMKKILASVEQLNKDFKEGRITHEEYTNGLRQPMLDLGNAKQKLVSLRAQLMDSIRSQQEEMERRQAARAVPVANTGCTGSGCAVMGGSRKRRKTRKYRKSRKNRK